ncbi:family 16 glycoside hydrolase [Bacteroidota bacterium]
MNKFLNTLIYATMVFTFSECESDAQQKQIAIPFDSQEWTIVSDDYKLEEFDGQESIYLPQGTASLKDVVFQDGIIEYDVAFPETRGFPGLFFRIQDSINSEEFYTRPHQSGNPDATQYQPIFNGSAGWQLYHGDGYSAAVKYRYNEWNHVKLVISGTEGEVYVNDLETPLFRIHELKYGLSSGYLALRGSAESHFANFRYTPIDNPELKSERKEIEKYGPETISEWEVSNAFNIKTLEGITELKKDLFNDLEWTKLSVESSGTANLARVGIFSQETNTVFVKKIIKSNKDQIKRLDLGFSDMVIVYINGRAVYSGDNAYRSRDYRYLGTIGYFDSVYSTLKKGDNEIIIAVMERFGGWGIKAKFDDPDGIIIGK